MRNAKKKKINKIRKSVDSVCLGMSACILAWKIPCHIKKGWHENCLGFFCFYFLSFLGKKNWFCHLVMTHILAPFLMPPPPVMTSQLCLLLPPPLLLWIASVWPTIFPCSRLNTTLINSSSLPGNLLAFLPRHLCIIKYCENLFFCWCHSCLSPLHFSFFVNPA